MKTINRFKNNDRGRDFIIGDLHGCYDLLTESLKDVDFDKKVDRCFSVGDLIDRGPDSFKCLQLAYEKWFHPVLGNHESLMFEGMLRKSEQHFNCWLSNGGAWVYEEFTSAHEINALNAILKDVEHKFPLAIEVEVGDKIVGVVHADSPIRWCEEDMSKNKEAAIWGRSRLPKGNEDVIAGIDHVYSGHTPDESAPVTLGNITYLDSGAVWTGRLVMHQL